MACAYSLSSLGAELFRKFGDIMTIRRLHRSINRRNMFKCASRKRFCSVTICESIKLGKDYAYLYNKYLYVYASGLP